MANSTDTTRTKLARFLSTKTGKKREEERANQPLAEVSEETAAAQARYDKTLRDQQHAWWTLAHKPLTPTEQQGLVRVYTVCTKLLNEYWHDIPQPKSMQNCWYGFDEVNSVPRFDHLDKKEPVNEKRTTGKDDSKSDTEVP